ncbi:MAG: hypothetical protein E7Z84_06100 [Methanosphaera stadtmanae]|nr:hypothetical protein [Methanosphaera stadtmanae]
MYEEILNKNIGIIGAGNIGQALTCQLVNKNFPKNQIRISHNNSNATTEKLRRLSLENIVTNNQEIIEKSDIIIFSVKPQDFKKMPKFETNSKQKIISFMAGIEVENLIEKTNNEDIIRVIPTGPDTIINSSAIAGLYPNDNFTSQLLNFLDIQFYVVKNNYQMDLMTLVGCLPAVYCICDPTSEENMNAIVKIADDFPEFIDASLKTIPLVPKENKGAFVKKVSTPGGVTEAIITSLREGNSLYDSLLKGIERNHELS